MNSKNSQDIISTQCLHGRYPYPHTIILWSRVGVGIGLLMIPLGNLENYLLRNYGMSIS